MPTVINSLGLHFLFFFHGIVCAIAALFVFKFVPETRGKTLLQLCSIYSSRLENIKKWKIQKHKFTNTIL